MGLPPYGEDIPEVGIIPPAGIGRRTGGRAAAGAGAMGCGCDAATDAWGIIDVVVG